MRHPIQKFSAVVVLANLMDAQGQLNEETEERVKTGVSALHRGLAPAIVMCGWAYRDDSDICIADAMARYAVDTLRVDSSNILTEPSSRDTVGDAVFTKRNLANPLNWRGVLVATSAYHCPRTLEIFSFVYGPTVHVEALPAKGEMTTQLSSSEAKSLAAFRSTFNGVPTGSDEAIYERLRKQHPFYNGDIYPTIDQR
ncbi:YdcF family protein